MKSVEERVSETMFEDKEPVRSNGGLLGFWGNCQVLMVMLPQGKVHIALAVQEIIDKCKPEVVMCVGKAMSLTTALLPGSIIVGSHFCYYDVCLDGMDFGRYPKEPTYYHSSDDVVSRMIDAGMIVHQGLFVSGDHAICNRTDAKKVANRLKRAKAFDYETTPVAQVCHANGVPFVSVRVIYDVPVMEDKAKLMYNQFRMTNEVTMTDKLLSILGKTMESL